MLRNIKAMNDLMVNAFLEELEGIEKNAAMPKYLRGIAVPLKRRASLADRALRDLSTKTYVKATTAVPYAGKALEAVEDFMHQGPPLPPNRHMNRGF